jgi:hypothetical protein
MAIDGRLVSPMSHPPTGATHKPKARTPTVRNGPRSRTLEIGIIFLRLKFSL